MGHELLTVETGSWVCGNLLHYFFLREVSVVKYYWGKLPNMAPSWKPTVYLCAIFYTAGEWGPHECVEE